MESVPACYYFTFVVPNQFPAKFPTFLFEESNDPGKTILVKFHVVRGISTFHSVHFSSLVGLAVPFRRSFVPFRNFTPLAFSVRFFKQNSPRCVLSTNATPVTGNSARSTPLNARYRSDNIDSSLRLGPMQSDNASTTMLTKTMGESTCSPTTDGAKGFTRVSITRGSQHPPSRMFA